MVPKSKGGFTIVEMMIALSIFSIIVLLTAAVIIGIAKQYQKSTYTTNLNDASRTVHSVIGDAIAYGGTVNTAHVSAPGGSGGFYYFCTDSNRYFWRLSSGSTVEPTYPGLYKDTNSACDEPLAADAANAENLLPKNGFVTKFSITPAAGNIYAIASTFRVGSTDMFEDRNDIGNDAVACLATQKGGDFCTVVTYTSSVVKKVGTNQ